MIEGILTFQFVLNQKVTGEVIPEFQAVQLLFNNKDFTEQHYSELITQTDIFSIFYNHTTSVHDLAGGFSNFYTGRLKETPYQVISFFKQLPNESQYLTISIFSLTDEIEVYEELIKNMGKRLDYIFETLEKAKESNQISILTNINKSLRNELKFTSFQVERLSNLDKIQKVALIFNSYERLTILETLRNSPRSKRQIKEILERVKENPNIDILLEPFLELNLIRRDWIKGKRDKHTGMIKNQGEYLFLVKDIILARVPNLGLIEYLKSSNPELAEKYEEKVVEYFSSYDPNTQDIEETKKIASLLLNPDIYDNIVLLKTKYYPTDKIPNIFSEFADVDEILDDLKKLNIITEITDKKGRTWILLLTDLKPIIYFPEFLLLNIRKAYKTEEKEEKIPLEVAKKAFELLEIAYPEKIEF